MKKYKTLIVFFLCCTNLLFSKTYYVSSSLGKENNNGLSEDKPLDNLKEINLSKGDSILFNRGDNFKGEINLSNLDNIYIGAYGKSNNNPVISGDILLNPSEWFNEGENIWSHNIDDLISNEVKSVFSDKKLFKLANFKSQKNTYFMVEKVDGNLIESSEFKSKNIKNLTNIDVILRTKYYRSLKIKNVYIDDRMNLVIPKEAFKKYDLSKIYGFFLLNHHNFLKTDGNWYYDSQKRKIFLFSLDNPKNWKISYVRDNYLFRFNDCKNLKIENINLKNVNYSAIDIIKSHNIYINNIKISNSFGNGIQAKTSTLVQLYNSKINKISWSGVYTDSSNNEIVISNNKIENIGDLDNAKQKAFIGIDCNSNNSKIEKNIINNTGYSGIVSAGKNNLIQYNVIDNVSLLLNDSGGIYINNNINDVGGTIIKNNIISNTIGNLDGTGLDRNLANGIYLDVGSHDVKVLNNTTINTNANALFINYSLGNIEVLNNKFIDSKIADIHIAKHRVFKNITISDNDCLYTKDKESHIYLVSEVIDKNNKNQNLVGDFYSNNFYSNFKIKPVLRNMRYNQIKDVELIFNGFKEKNNKFEILPKMEFFVNDTNNTKEITLKSSKNITITPFSSIFSEK